MRTRHADAPIFSSLPAGVLLLTEPSGHVDAAVLATTLSDETLLDQMKEQIGVKAEYFPI
jgi:hypothetical protein